MTTIGSEGDADQAWGKVKIASDRIYSPAEVARYLGVQEQTLAKWRCSNRGPTYRKIGRTITYVGRDVQLFEDRCRIEVKGAA